MADVDRLLQLRAAMVAELGKGGDAAVLHLSKAYCGGPAAGGCCTGCACCRPQPARPVIWAAPDATGACQLDLQGAGNRPVRTAQKRAEPCYARTALSLHARCAPLLHLPEWFFDESDRSYTTPVGSYAAAVKLPTGCDLQLHIDAQNSYRPRWVVVSEEGCDCWCQEGCL